MYAERRVRRRKGNNARVDLRKCILRGVASGVKSKLRIEGAPLPFHFEVQVITTII